MMAIYGVLSIGIHLHAHYCCGKLTELSLYEPVKSCCANDDHPEQDGPAIRNNCCDFKHYDLKIDDTHAASYCNLVLPAVSVVDVQVAFPAIVITEKTHVPSVPVNGPPSDIPLFIQHHALVLYA